MYQPISISSHFSTQGSFQQDLWGAKAKNRGAGPQNNLQAQGHNIHPPPPYGREFLRGFGKAISEGLCASASFDLYVFSEG
jgi:hypothetical protein